MATPTQLTLPPELADRYEVLARQAGQAREEVMLAVLSGYLEAYAADEARLDAAIAAAARGEVVDVEEADAETEAFLARLGVTPGQLAAIKAEVAQEADAAYAPCG